MSQPENLEIDTKNLNDKDLEDQISLQTPLDENVPIDFSRVYALHTFVATLEGQVCVIRSDPLELLDDSNSYWWLVKCIKTDEIGYIPAENIETPFERLARLNCQKNHKIEEIFDDTNSTLNLKKPKRNLIFADGVNVVYLNGEQEVSVYCDEIDPFNESEYTLSFDNNDSEKLNRKLSKTFRTSFLFKKFLKPKRENSINLSQDDALSTDLGKSEPINVLRIFAGNVDLKATFKTVAINKHMKISDLLEASVKKFRINNASPKEYYLSVLHMDSQEKRINEDDKLFEFLDALRHKSLPGVGDFTKVKHSVVTSGKISSVKVNDDNIIKIIINKKLNLFEKNYHLMRVFMYDDEDDTGKIRLYKTIGVDSMATVDTVIQLSIKKFKLEKEEGYEYSLHSIFKDLGCVFNSFKFSNFYLDEKRDGSENIRNILQIGDGTSHDIDFVLRKNWIGIGSAPRNSQTYTENIIDNDKIVQSSDNDLQELLKHKPSFLEENNSNTPAGTSITSISRNASLESSNADTIIKYEDEKFKKFQSPLSNTSELYNLDIENNSHSTAIEFPTVNTNKIVPPPRKMSLPTSSQPQGLNSLDTRYSSPTQAIEINGRKTPDYNTSVSPTPPLISNRSSSTTGSAHSETNINQNYVSNGLVSNQPLKPKFQYMEQYLDEIMKDEVNPEKIDYLETVLKGSKSDINDIRKSSHSGGEYQDSGLSTLIKKNSNQQIGNKLKSPSIIISEGRSSPTSSGLNSSTISHTPRYSSSPSTPSATKSLSNRTSSVAEGDYNDCGLSSLIERRRSLGNNFQRRPSGSNRVKIRPNSMHTSGHPSSMMSLFDGLEAEINNLKILSESSSNGLEKSTVLNDCKEAEIRLDDVEKELDLILGNVINVFNEDKSIAGI
ncbi:hypothetical protein HDU92_003697 [Lobulomyces angularis]|nr:hypothetical protein HDU92_003697 [Lobulomyces angularis]